MAINRVAAVTGANKGIGLAIVRNLALTYPSSPLKSGPFTIYLTARSDSRGADAVASLNADPQLKAAKALVQDGGDTTIRFQTLDISDASSVKKFAAFLSSEHPDGIDVVVNNAGIALDGFDSNVVRKTLETNYYSLLNTSKALLPTIREGGRMVNVTSSVGKLDKYSEEITAAFQDAAKTSTDAVTKVMQRFQSASESDEDAEKGVKAAGFPSAAYATSKAGANAVTMALAVEERAKGRGVLVNACCPGFVNTEMTKGRGKRTVDEGAKTPVFVALSDIGGKSGEFWYNEEVTPWQ
ncbi:related to carbonyl reductase [Ramularia collo-cygni]|uniref:Related to carbonyl reductase n=1 Tax=Ramularia collo-cygni TaxID=112498 RepID=A0A2D3UXL6_9PEZI|nr:related to carbonyl reductase [Ramularia collo-cygni]CZT15886.1 related to carbonyl reductase [Ramularia collo-cygni]